MKYTQPIFVVILICIWSGEYTGATQNTYPEEIYHARDLNYIDFIYHAPHIWAISEEGTLVLWNIHTNIPEEVPYDLERIISINTTRHNDIYVGDRDGNILKFISERNTWEVLYSLHIPVYGVYILNAHTQYAVTEHGVLNLVSKELFRPHDSINSQLDYTTKRVPGKPSATFCDSNNNIWLGYDNGEWGGDIQVFSTTHDTYLPLHIEADDLVYGKRRIPLADVLPIQSIFEGIHDTIYVTSGGQHFMTHGAILQFRQTPSEKTFNQKTQQDVVPFAYHGIPIFMAFPSKEHDGEYIGPGSFHPYNHNIYVYSEHGFSRFANDSQESGLIRTHVLQPRLIWKFGRENAMGYSMNVLKFEFIDEHTMIFLTRFNGIGVFDGQVIKFYK